MMAFVELVSKAKKKLFLEIKTSFGSFVYWNILIHFELNIFSAKNFEKKKFFVCSSFFSKTTVVDYA